MENYLELPTEKETVVLRELTLEDAPAYFAAVDANREHLSQFDDSTANNYPDLESVEASIRDPKNPNKIRMGIWDGDTFVGSANLTPDEDEQGTEMGYWLDQHHQGHGYATIAARALSRYGQERFGEVRAEVSAEEVDGAERVNDKSVAVLERAGFHQIDKQPGKLLFMLGEVATEDAQEKRESSSVTIREPQAGDLPKLRPLLEQWVRDRETGELREEEIAGILEQVETSLRDENNSYQYVVAANGNGDVVGLMGMTEPGKYMQPYAKTDRPVELVNAFVDSAVRGAGVGRQLVENLEAAAEDSGRTEVIVNSGPRYKDSGWAFWTRMYGEPIDVRKDLYGPGGDSPVWRKTLNQV